jgi:hypothetical protein
MAIQSSIDIAHGRLASVERWNWKKNAETVWE